MLSHDKSLIAEVEQSSNGPPEHEIHQYI